MHSHIVYASCVLYQGCCWHWRIMTHTVINKYIITAINMSLISVSNQKYKSPTLIPAYQLIRTELHVNDPSAFANSEFGKAIFGTSSLSHTLKLSGYSSFGGWSTTPLMKRQFAPLLSGNPSLWYLKWAFISMSLHPMLPALVSEMAMRSNPAMEHIDLRCRTGCSTVTAVTGQWGKVRARNSIPAWRYIDKGIVYSWCQWIYS